MPILIILGILLCWFMMWLKELYDGNVNVTSEDVDKMIKITEGQLPEITRKLHKEYIRNIRRGNLKANEEMYNKYVTSKGK